MSGNGNPHEVPPVTSAGHSPWECKGRTARGSQNYLMIRRSALCIMLGKG